MEYRIRLGSIQGSDHKRIGKNNQDSLDCRKTMVNGKEYLFGVVCDGCSAGAKSETGAHLMASYITSEIPMILHVGVSLEEVPQALYARCVGYLSAVASQTNVGDAGRRLEFIINHLLCTIIGFVMDDEKVVFFSAGDGVIIINDEFTSIDQDNKPKYLGYHLVDRRYLASKDGVIPQSFAVEVRQMEQINHFAVCSDGMLKEAVNDLWGHAENENGVQWKLKVLALRKLNFHDDCTVIVVEKLPPTEGVEVNIKEDIVLYSGIQRGQEGGGDGEGKV